VRHLLQPCPTWSPLPSTCSVTSASRGTPKLRLCRVLRRCRFELPPDAPLCLPPSTAWTFTTGLEAVADGVAARDAARLITCDADFVVALSITPPALRRQSRAACALNTMNSERQVRGRNRVVQGHRQREARDVAHIDPGFDTSAAPTFNCREPVTWESCGRRRLERSTVSGALRQRPRRGS
jgi:hypothetical protein